MLGSKVSESVKRWVELSVGWDMFASDPGAMRAAAGPVGLAQLAFHDLADGAARQRRAELHADQPLRLAELAVGPLLDLLLARGVARAPHAERQRLLAPLLARDPDHRNVDHVGVLQQQHLDVGGVDVEAARD